MSQRLPVPLLPNPVRLRSNLPVVPSVKPARPPVKEKSAKPALPPLELHSAKGKFLWPVKGNVVRSFGNNGGSVSKGLEISAPSGSVIRASAAGKVTYSGNEIKGYGNLIILKHDESFFTVYGFNQENLVHTGEYVGKEQQIALLGLPPGGDSPRLHFEIRRGKEALDPLHFLP
jgi:septal ring factor EnvC (AmiA/AmiB activator)